VIGVVAVLVAGLLGGIIGRAASGPAPAASVRTAASGVTGSCDAVTVASKVLPTIVTVSIRNGAASGVGSGEIISKDGYIVTNNHVISAAANAGTISVLYSSGESADAKLVGRDPASDLAVLKVSSSTPLPTITLGASKNVVVGEPVVALGAPLGLSGSVTAGIVSALDRDVPVPSDNDTTAVLAGAIQTDAAINPGNSGGALVDCSGHLIGINTAIATVPNEAGQGGGGSVGIGFAVPIDLANSIVKQIIDTGHASYPYFGASIAPIPSSAADRFDVTDGVYVVSVVPGGPVAQAGIKAGDVITTIDGLPAARSDVLTRVTLTKKPGDVIKVDYVRGNAKHSTSVTLGSAPAPASSAG
jgi:putative serine protease PepD